MNLRIPDQMKCTINDDRWWWIGGLYIIQAVGSHLNEQKCLTVFFNCQPCTERILGCAGGVQHTVLLNGLRNMCEKYDPQQSCCTPSGSWQMPQEKYADALPISKHLYTSGPLSHYRPSLLQSRSFQTPVSYLKDSARVPCTASESHCCHKALTGYYDNS